MTKRSIFIFVSLVLSLAAAQSAYPTVKFPYSSTTLELRPVLLQVNNYYVLYTYPEPPFLDRAGRVWLPLVGFALMVQESGFSNLHLSLPLVYDSKTQTAHLTFKGKTLSLQAGSNQAQIDGKTIELPAPPFIGTHGRMMVPLAPLAEAFDLQLVWDPRFHMARLQGEGLLGIVAWGAEFAGIHGIHDHYDPYLIPETFAFDPNLTREPWPAPQDPDSRTSGVPQPLALWLRNTSRPEKGPLISGSEGYVCFIDVVAPGDYQLVKAWGNDCGIWALPYGLACFETAPGYFCQHTLSGKPTLLALVQTYSRNEPFLGHGW